jgi:protein-S-isoprenylcysteine O-methyltransferase Ste14
MMSIFREYLPLIIYALFFGGLKFSERMVISRPGSTIRKSWGDWTAWLILVPLWLSFIGPVLEFVILNRQPRLWEMILGGVLFAASGLFSIKGYLDLQRGFSQAVELEDTSLVVTGLYHTLRHPISLGNILFCISCPLFLGAGPSWIPALVGIFTVMFRISIEESFMQQHIPDYADYKERTWALIPFIY